jgi:hypothetical protein
MAVYDQGKANHDGRGMSRALDRINAQLRASVRVTAAGDIPDTTPPPTEVVAGNLAQIANYERFAS